MVRGPKFLPCSSKKRNSLREETIAKVLLLRACATWNAVGLCLRWKNLIHTRRSVDVVRSEVK